MTAANSDSHIWWAVMATGNGGHKLWQWRPQKMMASTMWPSLSTLWLSLSLFAARHWPYWVVYVCIGKQAVVVMSCENVHMAEDMMVEPGLVMIFAHGVEWLHYHQLQPVLSSSCLNFLYQLYCWCISSIFLAYCFDNFGNRSCFALSVCVRIKTCIYLPLYFGKSRHIFLTIFRTLLAKTALKLTARNCFTYFCGRNYVKKLRLYCNFGFFC